MTGTSSRRGLLAAAAFGTLAACAARETTRFYLLTPTEAAAPAARPRPLTLGLLPIELAAYLDRAQIVSRRGGEALTVSDYDRWAEPLGGMLARVLAQDLERLAPGVAVIPLPTGLLVRPDRELAVRIERLEDDGAGHVRLEARWQLVDRRGGTVLAQGQPNLSEASAVPLDYAAVARASSRLMAALAALIVPTLR